MKLHEKIQATAELCGRPLTDNAVDLMMRALKNEPEIEVSKALDGIARSGGRLTLAAVFERLPGAPLGAEEAWALSEPCLDEALSAVLTEAMHEAIGLVRPLGSDRIAQRMAFKDAYTRLSANDGRNPKWRPTLGTDHSHRVLAVREAYAQGRLTRVIAHRYLPPDESIDGDLPALPVGPSGPPTSPRSTAADAPVSFGKVLLAELKRQARS